MKSTKPPENQKWKIKVSMFNLLVLNFNFVSRKVYTIYYIVSSKKRFFLQMHSDSSHKYLYWFPKNVLHKQFFNFLMVVF